MVLRSKGSSDDTLVTSPRTRAHTHAREMELNAEMAEKATLHEDCDMTKLDNLTDGSWHAPFDHVTILHLRGNALSELRRVHMADMMRRLRIPAEKVTYFDALDTGPLFWDPLKSQSFDNQSFGEFAVRSKEVLGLWPRELIHESVYEHPLRHQMSMVECGNTWKHMEKLWRAGSRFCEELDFRR